MHNTARQEPRFQGVTPSKRVMGLNWCPQCWGWELSFCLVHWYCWSWTTCLRSPLSQSCPYTTHPSSSRLLSRPFRGCSCAPSTAVLVNQPLLPGKLPKPGTAKRDWSFLEAPPVPCPQQLHTKTAPGTLRQILLTHSQILCQILSLFSSPTSYASVSSSYLFWPHTSGDRHTLDSAVWSRGRTGQQYPSVFNPTVSSLETLKTQ